MSNPFQSHDDQSLASLVGRIEKARSSLSPRPGTAGSEDLPDDESPVNIIPSMGNVGNPTARGKGSPAKPPLPPSSQSLTRSGSNVSMNRDASIGSFTAAYFPPEPAPKAPTEVPPPSYFRDPGESQPPPTEMAILGIPDDVSTIANDTLNGSITGSMLNFFRKQPVTPDRQKITNTQGEEAPPGFRGTIQIPSSSKDQDLPMHVDSEPSWSGKKYFYAGILAVFLLAAIGALSYGFLKVRDLNSVPTPVDEKSDKEFAWTLRPTVMATAAPGQTPTLKPNTAPTPPPTQSGGSIPGGSIPQPPPTNPPTGQPSRTPTGEPTTSPTVSASNTLAQLLRDISPSIVEKIESGATKQAEAFDWLINDPDFFEYTDSKLVQRWALALFSLEIASTRRRLTGRHLNEAMETWMKYTDECTWFTSWYENRVACDGTGTFKFLVLRNIGLDGTIPSELALLSKLDTLVLSDNNIEGTIPEELGNWTGLEHFEVQSNQLQGTIPATFGQMTGLVVLDVGNNLLTGPIPNELGNLVNAQTVKFNNNQLTGPIPQGVSNMEGLINLDLSTNSLTGTIPPMDRLKLLSEVNLSNTDLNGAVPVDLCSFNLNILEADCDDVFCSCCTNCESVGTPGPTVVPAPSSSPTLKPSISATPTVSPTPRPTPKPTLWPTPAPTSQQCQDRIATTKSCFTTGEVINLTFKNCLPVGNDWVGVYDSGKLPYELYNPMMWEYSCGSQACYGATTDGFLSFDDRSTGTENWPLRPGSYKAWIFRDGDANGPYYAYAATEAFTVSDTC